MIYTAPIEEINEIKHGDVIIGTDKQLYLVNDSINNSDIVDGCEICCFYNKTRNCCNYELFKNIICDYNKLPRHHSCVCGIILFDFCKITLIDKEPHLRCYTFKKIKNGI